MSRWESRCRVGDLHRAADANSGDTIHIVVKVTDDGAHNLKHYQRVVVTVA